MLEAMKNAGFIQYEISNFCKDNMFSRHNSNYWKKEHYLGLGPSAHSFDGSSRQWNKANNALYIKGIETGKPGFEKEELTTEQRYNEYVLTTLRTMWGADLNYIISEFGDEFHQYILKASSKYSGEMIESQKNKLFLTDKGKLFADRIASDLFKIKE